MEADFDSLTSSLLAIGYRVSTYNPLLVDTAVPVGFTLHDLVNDLVGPSCEPSGWQGRSLLDRAGVGAFHVIGHAFGGRVTRLASILHPQRVLTSTSLATGGRVPAPPEVSAALLASFDLSRSDAERLAALELALFADGNDASVWLDGWFPAVIRAEIVAAGNTPATDFFLGGPQPMLIIQGEHDAIAPKENALMLLEERSAPTEVVMLANSGHALLPEQPHEIARAVRRFLRTHD